MIKPCTPAGTRQPGGGGAGSCVVSALLISAGHAGDLQPRLWEAAGEQILPELLLMLV